MEVDPDLLSFGQAVRRRRTALGLSQEELADRSGLHRTYISQLERAVKSPSIQKVEQLATALKVAAGELLD